MKNKKKERGMVLLVVTAAILMMMIVVVGLLSRSTSRAIRSEADIRRLQAELLAKGAFWRSYQDSGSPASSVTYTINTAVYTVQVGTSSGTGPGATDTVVTTVRY
jgi:type II secretory pathway component PulK